MPTPDLIRRRFEGAKDTYLAHARVQALASAHLAQRLGTIRSPIRGRALDIGCGVGRLTRQIHADHEITSWVLNDLYEPPGALAQDLAPATVSTRIGDAQIVDFGTGYDLVCAGSSLHWLADPMRLVARLPQMLNPDGLFAMVTYGPGNLNEIATLTDHALAYAEPSQWVEWIESTGLVVLNYECRVEVEHFDTPLAALKSLKATGVNATAGRSIRTPAALRRLEADWRTQFSTPEGQITLTWRPLWIIATKPA